MRVVNKVGESSTQTKVGIHMGLHNGVEQSGNQSGCHFIENQNGNHNE